MNEADIVSCHVAPDGKLNAIIQDSNLETE